MLATVTAGAAGVVAVAFLLGFLLPDASPTAQILANRSRPARSRLAPPPSQFGADLRDEIGPDVSVVLE